MTELLSFIDSLDLGTPSLSVNRLSHRPLKLIFSTSSTPASVEVSVNSSVFTDTDMA